MVRYLSLLPREVEVAVHLIVVKRSNAGCRQPERFRRQVEPLADRACFKMYVAVATIAMGAASIKAVHITDLRTALDQAYTAAGRPLPTYTDPGLVPGTTIKVAHIAELRAAIIAIE